MAGFNLADYEEVKDRIPLFWAKHPDGSILTELLHVTAEDYIVKASLVADDGRVITTGLAQETIGSSNVNKTSALENCETSAIGRALANGMFSSGKQRPSREEMEKVDRAPAGARLATENQRKEIERMVSMENASVPNVWPLADDLSMRDASGILDAMKAELKEPKAERKSSMRPEEAVVSDGTEPF